MTEKRKKVLSVVAPLYNEEETLPEFVRRLHETMAGLAMPYEIILVDDGSKDGSYGKACSLADKYPNISVVNFSRNFGHQAAVTAGMDMAIGDAVITIDSDLQDPPEIIPEMIKKWQEGYEMVYGKRGAREKETRFKLVTAKVFYRLLQYMTDERIPENAADFRLMDRKIVDTFKTMREKDRYIRGMMHWIGFNQTPLVYDRKGRFAGVTKYPFKKMALFALDAITSFSALPLRFITIFGFASLLGALLLGIVFLIVNLFKPSFQLLGWPFAIFLISFFGGAIISSVGIIGEYVGRIYQQIKNRPLYIVRDIYKKQT